MADGPGHPQSGGKRFRRRAHVNHPAGGIQRDDRRKVPAFKSQITVRIIFKNDQVMALGQFNEVLAALQ